MNATFTIRRPVTQSDLSGNAQTLSDDWQYEVIDGERTGFMVATELQVGMRTTVQIGFQGAPPWVPCAEILLLTAMDSMAGRQYTAVARNKSGDLLLLFNVLERFIETDEEWPEHHGRLICTRTLAFSQLSLYLDTEDVVSIETLIQRRAERISQLQPYAELKNNA